MLKKIFILHSSFFICVCAVQAQTPPPDLYSTGQWVAAEYEYNRTMPQTIEAQTFAALAAARQGEQGAGERLEELLAKYPALPYAGEARFWAGVLEYNAGNYGEARAFFDKVKVKRLDKKHRDEYYFKAGHLAFLADETRDAQWNFSQVADGSGFSPHADYFLAYMDYDQGNWAAAKQKFARLERHESYARIVPYYLLQMEFSEGNYAYVVERAAELMPSTTPDHRDELARMAALSRFKLQDYAGAISDLDTYLSLGGKFGREENYLMGYSLYRQTVYDRAAGYLVLASGADDSLTQNAAYILGDTYLRLGDPARALQSFSLAAGSGHDPQITEDALFNYGKLLYETDSGHFNEAINVLTRYLDTYPVSERSDVAREYLVAAYYNSRDYEAALEAIAALPDPDNNVKAALQKINYFRALEFYKTGDIDRAFELLNTSLGYRFNAKYTALATFWQGEILYSRGNFEAAGAKYAEYIRLSPPTEPENVMARYNLGYAEFNLGKWDGARKWFEDFTGKYSTKDPYLADAFNRTGDAYHALRDYPRAIAAYNKAAAVGTDEKYYAEYELAMMAGLSGRADDKAVQLQNIVKRGVGDHVEAAAFELGRSDVARGKYSAGAKALSAFIAKYPSSPLYAAALSNLGLANLNIGDKKSAMVYYKKLVETAPGSAEVRDAMEGIRGLYVDAGDVNGYLAYEKKVGKGGGTGDRGRDSLNFVVAERAYLTGDGAKAITALEKYVKENPKGRSIGKAQGYLAGLYFKALRYDDAAEAYKAAGALTADRAAKTRFAEGYQTSLRRADLAQADELRKEGRTSEATSIYEKLATDTATPEGAESAYRVIENLYKTGVYAQAENAVFDLSDSGTAHSYWLGQAFLTLGDIYVSQGDTFQARATYQSVVDGYSPANDGIVAEARQRIASLK